MTDFGETQIAAEVMSFGYERTEDDMDQTIFSMRVISTYVTFYKAVIPQTYWAYLLKDRDDPPKELIVIKRWPMKNGRKTGLDLADPNKREKVLRSLAKIRQYILSDN